MGRKLILILALSGCAHAQLWSNQIAASRAVDWTSAGAVIPTNWTQCVTAQCNTVSGGTVTAASINAAIASAPSNTYVLVPSGAYTISGMINWASKSNVSLRGAGADATTGTRLTINNFASSCTFDARICMISTNSGDGGDQNYNFAANWTAGYSVGTTSITIGTPFVKGAIGNISVGSIIFLDQLDDGSIPSSGFFVCQLANCSGGGSGNGREWRPSSQEEPQIVTSISGTGPWTIGISPGVRMPNISGTRTPQIWGNTGQPITNVGIENMSLDVRSSGNFSTVFMLDCVNCWVKGIKFIGPGTNAQGTYQVWAYQSRNVTVRDSYFYGTTGTSNAYALSNWGSADDLFENNISQHVSFSNMQEGCIGCVQGYNFAVDDWYTGTPVGSDTQWQQASSYHHGVGDAFILFEGNDGIGFTADDVHGTSNALTVFRNFYNGRDPNGGSTGSGKTEQTVPVLMYTFTRFNNIIGNVLGTPGYHSTYQCVYNSPTTCSNTAYIYSVGYKGDAANNDIYTGTSLFRWGNYDTKNGTNQFNDSEVPTGLTDGFANSIPANQNLPSSYYYAAKPSFVPSALPWPLAGPDVSGGDVGYCTGGTNAGQWVTSKMTTPCSGGSFNSYAGGRVYANPAMLCYLVTMGGAPSGGTTIYNFDANTCYPANQSSGSNKALGFTISGGQIH